MDYHVGGKWFSGKTAAMSYESLEGAQLLSTDTALAPVPELMPQFVRRIHQRLKPHVNG